VNAQWVELVIVNIVVEDLVEGLFVLVLCGDESVLVI